MTAFKDTLVIIASLFICCNYIHPVNPFVVLSTANLERRCGFQKNTDHNSFGRILRAQSDPENDIEQKTKDDVEKEDPVEEFLAIQEASNKVTQRLMMPRMIMASISQSITYAAYAFLIFSFALNVAGYSLIRDGDSIRIGTFEDRAFQMEIMNSMKGK
mmetsp:Transcript_14135/g.29461  ORF Transcript_14135/g.29461 Transcript_14135/m.29461 type:complete len:159 (-) Transcript_14135:1094-1570(-)